MPCEITWLFTKNRIILYCIILINILCRYRSCPSITNSIYLKTYGIKDGKTILKKKGKRNLTFLGLSCNLLKIKFEQKSGTQLFFFTKSVFILFYFILRGYQNERVLSVGGRIGKMGWLALWKNWESGKWPTRKMNPRFPNQNG